MECSPVDWGRSPQIRDASCGRLGLGMPPLVLALWRLPTGFPKRWEGANVTLSSRILALVATGTPLSGIIFLLITASQIPEIVGLLTGYCIAGLGYFHVRKRQRNQSDIDLETVMNQLAPYE